MKNINRRNFLRMAGIAGSMAMVPRTSLAAAPRVVVIGGGFGGASVAKYLRMWGGNVNVTLVDPASAHVSCILSNLVVTGLLGMNVEGIPYAKEPWAFWGVTGACLAIAIGVLGWFVRAQWIKSK